MGTCGWERVRILHVQPSRYDYARLPGVKKTFGPSLIDMYEIGLFFGSYGLLITPTFGVAQAFQGRLHDYHNVLGIYIIGVSF